MPHRSCIISFGEKVVKKVFFVSRKWKDTILKFNEVNTSFGLKEALDSNLSKMRRHIFEEYNAKKPQDNFA